MNECFFFCFVLGVNRSALEKQKFLREKKFCFFFSVRDFPAPNYIKCILLMNDSTIYFCSAYLCTS